MCVCWGVTCLLGWEVVYGSRGASREKPQAEWQHLAPRHPETSFGELSVGFRWLVYICVRVELGRCGHELDCECVRVRFPVGRLLQGPQCALEWTQVGQVDGSHSGLLPWASRASLSGPDSPQGVPPLCIS